jgi:undecaprenyl-diphosphatase
MDLINFLLPKIENLHLLGYWLVLLIAMTESLAFVGVLVPGTIIIGFVGFLSAKGWLDIGDLIWFVAMGVFLGDMISYYLGKYGHVYFNDNNKVFKLSYLKKGQVYFNNHGKKSLIIGKFIGPLRPVIPFVAGLSLMPFKIFFILEIIISIIWATFHLLLGYFFGQAWQLVELWSSRLGIFLLSLGLLVLVVYFLRLLVIKKGEIVVENLKLFFSFIFKPLRHSKRWNNFIKQYPQTIKFIKNRLDYSEFFGLPLSLLLVSFLVIIFIFLGLAEEMINLEFFSSSYVNIANLFYAFRHPGLLSFFSWITILGSITTLVIIALGVSLLLFLYKRFRYILPLWIALGGSGLFTLLAKILIQRPRPEAGYYIEPTYSFPSGHSSSALALYGFLAYIIFRNTEKWKIKINALFLAITLIFFIGLSRLYLGVHYLNDVSAGFLIGLLWLIIGISLAEWLGTRIWSIKPRLVSRSVRKIIVILLFLSFAVYYLSVGFLNQPSLKSTLASNIGNEVVVEKDSNFWQLYDLPKFAENYNGEKQKTLNFVIIAKNNELLASAFQRIGWQAADKLTWQAVGSLIKATALNERYATAPMSLSFWNNQINDLSFEKPDWSKKIKAYHYARLWKTNLQTKEGDFVYFASINLDLRKKYSLFHELDPNIDFERENLFENFYQAEIIKEYKKIQLVEPVKEVRYYTDGDIYIISLKEKEKWPFFL